MNQSDLRLQQFSYESPPLIVWASSFRMLPPTESATAFCPVTAKIEKTTANDPAFTLKFICRHQRKMIVSPSLLDSITFVGSYKSFQCLGSSADLNVPVTAVARTMT